MGAAHLGMGLVLRSEFRCPWDSDDGGGSERRGKQRPRCEYPPVQDSRAWHLSLSSFPRRRFRHSLRPRTLGLVANSLMATRCRSSSSILAGWRRGSVGARRSAGGSSFGQQRVGWSGRAHAHRIRSCSASILWPTLSLSTERDRRNGRSVFPEPKPIPPRGVLARDDSGELKCGEDDRGRARHEVHNEVRDGDGQQAFLSKNDEG